MDFIFEDRAILQRIWDQSAAIYKRKKVNLTVNKSPVHPVKKMFLGLRAQYAVNILLGTPYDWGVFEGNDNGVDGTLNIGTYQVKYTGYHGDPWLAFSKKQPLLADIAILVIPRINERINMDVSVIGYIKADRFFRLARKKAWPGYTADKAVHHSILSPFEELLPGRPVLKTQLHMWERRL